MGPSSTKEPICRAWWALPSVSSRIWTCWARWIPLDRALEVAAWTCSSVTHSGKKVFRVHFQDSLRLDAKICWIFCPPQTFNWWDDIFFAGSSLRNECGGMFGCIRGFYCSDKLCISWCFFPENPEIVHPRDIEQKELSNQLNIMRIECPSSHRICKTWTSAFITKRPQKRIWGLFDVAINYLPKLPR